MELRQYQIDAIQKARVSIMNGNKRLDILIEKCNVGIEVNLMSHAGFKIKTLKSEIAQDRPYPKIWLGLHTCCLELFVGLG